MYLWICGLMLFIFIFLATTHLNNCFLYINIIYIYFILFDFKSNYRLQNYLFNIVYLQNLDIWLLGQTLIFYRSYFTERLL